MSAVDEAIAQWRVNIPQTLRPQRRWLTWQRRPKPNKPGKFDKVPFYPDGRQRYGAQGRPEERAWLMVMKLWGYPASHLVCSACVPSVRRRGGTRKLWFAPSRGGA
jgi:hypothetical protein